VLFSFFSALFSFFFPSLFLDGLAIHPASYLLRLCVRRDSASAYRLHWVSATPTPSLRLDDYAASSHARTHRRHSPSLSLRSSRFAWWKRIRGRLGHSGCIRNGRASDARGRLNSRRRCAAERRWTSSAVRDTQRLISQDMSCGVKSSATWSVRDAGRYPLCEVRGDETRREASVRLLGGAVRAFCVRHWTSHTRTIRRFCFLYA
jgi:hypothetical protein